MDIKVTPEEEVQKYFDSDSINQSHLKKYIGGLDAYKQELQREEEKEGERPSDSLIKGSAVDIILTGNEGDYNSKFYESDMENLPSDTVKSIIEEVHSRYKTDRDFGFGEKEEKDLGDLDETVVEVAREFHYQDRWKDGTLFNKIVKEGNDYFNLLKRSEGKIIISAVMANTVRKVVESFRNKSVFQMDRSVEYEGIDLQHYQQPIYFTYRGEGCKALIDRVDYKKKGKTLHIYPLDIKTTYGNTIDFVNQLKSHRYDIQAAWYVLALHCLMKQRKIKDYVIHPFRFAVESTVNIGEPLMYAVKDDILEMGKKGRKRSVFYSDVPYNSVPLVLKGIKGYEKLMLEHKYYKENLWERDILLGDKELHELGWNGIEKV